SLRARQAPGPADRVPPPSGGLDRGARDARVPAQAAGPLVAWAARVPPLPPGHALAAEVRPHRVVRAAGVLDLRVPRPAGRAWRLPPAAAALRHGAGAAFPVHQLPVPVGLPPRVAGLRRDGERLRRSGGHVALPTRAGRPAPARPAALQPPPRRADP